MEKNKHNPLFPTYRSFILCDVHTCAVPAAMDVAKVGNFCRFHYEIYRPPGMPLERIDRMGEKEYEALEHLADLQGQLLYHPFTIKEFMKS